MSIYFESSREHHSKFRTGISLHSHTNHSKESLTFIYGYATESPLLRAAVQRGEQQYAARHNGSRLDFNCAWWTPPLAPRDAWKLEKRHIEKRFQMEALVSLSDHDDIEAGMSLRVLSECGNVPVSVEWTVPFRGTFFHIGLHNLPIGSARRMMARCEQITAAPTDETIREMLSWVNETADSLVIFNHPCWDESRFGAQNHRAAMLEFIALYGHFLHALEINGLRPWAENQTVIETAATVKLPVISGGDRHALEPNVVLNLTNETSFAAFAAEVKAGRSQVLMTNQYFEPFRMRIVQSIADILEGRWTDRVFYICDDGVTRSLSELFVTRTPTAVRFFTAGIQVLRRGIGIVRPFAAKPSLARPAINRLPA